MDKEVNEEQFRKFEIRKYLNFRRIKNKAVAAVINIIDLSRALISKVRR